MDRLYAQIGGRMRALRKALRMTQAQVAESAGIDSSFYGQIERGANIPSLKTFLAIAKSLQAQPADFFPDAKDPAAAYSRVIEKLVAKLDSDKKRLVLGVVSDMVDRLKKPGI